MDERINDESLRHLATDAMRMYEGFDEVFPGNIVEAVMRHLPPDFDRQRVERIVASVML